MITCGSKGLLGLLLLQIAFAPLHAAQWTKQTPAQNALPTADFAEAVAAVTAAGTRIFMFGGKVLDLTCDGKFELIISVLYG